MSAAPANSRIAITKPNSRCSAAVGEADGADQRTTEDQTDEHQAGSGSTEHGARAVERRRTPMEKTEEGITMHQAKPSRKSQEDQAVMLRSQATSRSTPKSTSRSPPSRMITAPRCRRRPDQGSPDFRRSSGGRRMGEEPPQSLQEGDRRQRRRLWGAAAPARGFPRILAQTPDPASNHQETPTAAAGYQPWHGSEQIGRRRSFSKVDRRPARRHCSTDVHDHHLPTQPWRPPTSTRRRRPPPRPRRTPPAGAAAPGAAALHPWRRRQIPHRHLHRGRARAPRAPLAAAEGRERERRR